MNNFKKIKKMLNQPINIAKSIFITSIIAAASFISYADDDDGLGPTTQTMIDSFDFQLMGGMIGRLKPHGNELMGDMIDKKTGGITFEQTDISLPGNSGLEVALRRKLKQGEGYYSPNQQAFGNWDLDLPVAYITHGVDTSSPLPEFNNGCKTSNGGIDRTLYTTLKGAFPIEPGIHALGTVLSVPGKNLSGYPSNASSSTIGILDPKNNWISGGKGVDHENRCAEIVISPNGTKYKFGHVVRRKAKEVWFDFIAQGPTSSGVSHAALFTPILARIYSVYLITEVEDTHGNWVRYDYTNDNRAELERIYSNDGREINLFYNSTLPEGSRNSRRVTHVTTNGRTWNYEYNNASSNPTASLKKVILPDSRYWDFYVDADGSRAMQYEPYRRWNCIPIARTMKMKHPDGAIGIFTLRETRHIKNADKADSYVSDFEIRAQDIKPASIDPTVGFCDTGGPNGINLNPPYLSPFFRSISIISKTISAPDIPDATWSFDYRGYTGGQIDTTWTKITEPDNTVRTYTYQTLGYDHGLIKRIDVHDSSNKFMESFDYEYGFEQGQPCDSGGEFGNDAGICFLYYKRPQTKIIHTRDSETYTTERIYNTNASDKFVDYGFPNKINYFSTLQSEKRIVDVEYKHDLTNHFIGLTERVVRNGKEFSRYVYNDKGLKQNVYSFGDKRLTYTYHPDGNAKTITEHATNTINYTAKLENYYRGQPRKITRRDGGVLLKTIDANGWVTSETDAIGYKTTYDYTPVGWMKKIDRPLPWNDTTVTYSNIGTTNFYSTENQGAKVTTTHYDSMLRPTLEVTNPTSGSGSSIYIKTEYDGLSRAVFTSLPSFSSNPTLGTNTTYDGLSRVIKTEQNFSPYVSSQTDYLSGNRMQITDARGNDTITSRSGYSSPTDGNVISIQSPENVTTTMTYDIYGNMLTTNQGGNSNGFNVGSTQRWFYDNRLRVCRHYVPETGSKLFQYNNIDQVIAYSEGQAYSTACTTPSANKVSLTYDPVGRLKVTNFPSTTPDISRSYDKNGNLKTVNRGSSAWVYKYFNNSLLQRESLTIDELDFVTTYTRDGNGSLSGINYPSGDSVNFTPDGFGRATSAVAYNTDYFGVYADDVEYHPNNSLKHFEYGNGVVFNQTLNNRQLPHTRNATISGKQDPMRLTYLYDDMGNTTRITDNVDSSRTINNSFDGLDRLRTSNSSRGNITFTYDALGNLRKRNVVGGSALGGAQHGVTVTFNSLNQVNKATNIDGTRSFTHDSRGNVKTNSTHNFTYDFANQPTSISGQQTGNFTYDGHLKRVKQTVDGKTSYSVYTQEAGLLSQYNKTTNTHTDHIRIAGTTVARIESKGSKADDATTAFDERAESPVAAGSLADRPHYLPFGKKINATVVKENAIGFTGHVEDTSGLVYMQARYYDPVIGRFYSNDPVGTIEHLNTPNGIHGFNRYAYANNNPYKYTDPDGKSPCLGICTAIVVTLKAVHTAYKVYKSNKRIKKVLKNKESTGKKGEFKASTGTKDVNKDFKTLTKGSDVKTHENGTKVGKLPDGRTVDNHASSGKSGKGADVKKGTESIKIKNDSGNKTKITIRFPED